MSKKWKFYEKLNEIVYACDIKTLEIEYINAKGLEAYGYTSLDEVKGRKCYDVLQRRSTPCPNCTNPYLKPGCFYEWQSANPILGKTYALKDTIIEENGRAYRLEVAIDMTVQEEQKKVIQVYANNEAMINEGLRVALSQEMPEQSLCALLEYLGQRLQGERVYVFEEREDGTVDNTYEWCAKGIRSEQQSLQGVPFEVVSLWYRSFWKDENVIITQLEATKESDPLAYEYLKPQNIETLAVGPIVNGDKIIGFFGIDNPPPEQLNHISSLLEIIGHFIASILKRRDLVRRLENLSYYDQLTGLKNRHAMEKYFASLEEGTSLGLFYVDVTGLKEVNDTEGHHKGDAMLKKASQCLLHTFDGYELFRIGGDEFLVLCKGIREADMDQPLEQLRAAMKRESVLMAVGSAWEACYRHNFEQLLKMADAKMYQDKKEHYANTGIDRRNRSLM